MIYQFAIHTNLPAGSAMPLDPMFALYRKSRSGAKLTREEKDMIAQRVYGLSGMTGSTYKAGGFAAPFHDHLPRILAQDPYNSTTWHQYHAPDITSLRRALYGAASRTEMIQV